MNSNSTGARPAFYTVREAAEILRVAPSTLYRAIREGDFPSVRVRSRCVIPTAAVERLAAEAAESGKCVDLAQRTAEERIARDVARMTRGASW